VSEQRAAVPHQRIRHVRQRELPTLQEIERAAGRCFADIGMPEVAADAPLPVSVLDRYRQASLAWVATGPDDMPWAYLVAERLSGSLHVEQVSVHPAYARRGIGRALVEHSATHAAALGIPALTLTTFEQVPWNAPYYLRCGFRVLGASEWTSEMRAIRAREAEHGLDRWPRVAMRKELAAVDTA
jgi:GNAT superfamily N-acetyltransferase